LAGRSGFLGESLDLLNEVADTAPDPRVKREAARQLDKLRASLEAAPSPTGSEAEVSA